MHNLPKPKLGDVTAITIASPDLEKSLQYYQQLGFAEVQRMDFPFPWIQISDGALLIMLRQDKTPYIALTYYIQNSEMEKAVSDLESAGIKFSSKPKESDMVKRYLFQSPDNFNISIVSNLEDVFKQPPGPTMLNMPQQDYFNPEKYVNKVCGLYGEFAQPVANLDKSISFWTKLGFNTLSKYESPYPWAILSDGLAIVGLHQTKDFSIPIITFFASDMKGKIEKLKQQGLNNFFEKNDSNIVLTTPEQQKINLFKLGM
jgi:catechol 2,3-dioxygenase-like lactoylglutathione lyase family enzyme